MNITVYMAMSIDGKVARTNDETPWSDESWDAFNERINIADAFIIGRETYEIMDDEGSLEDIKIPVIVLSSKETTRDGVVVFEKLEDALNHLEKKSLIDVVVAGGSIANGSFIKAGLVNDLIIDVEPILLGKGKPLFDVDFDDLSVDDLPNFELVEFKKLGTSNTLQLTYTKK